MSIETAELLNQEQNTTAPGTILMLRRKELGWSEREVAEKLRLLPQQVLALEENRFDAFNAEIFTKGYLRSYAKLVSLDDQGLLALYEQHYQKTSSDSAPVAQSLADLPAQQPASRRYLGVVAALLVVVVLWVFNTNDEADSLEPNTVALSAQGVEAEKPESNLSVTDEQGGIDTPEQLTSTTEALAESLSQSVSSEPVDVVVSKPQTEAPPANESVPEAEIAAHIPSLKLEFSGDCWVEIKDAMGTVLIADMKRAEQIINLPGAGPFNVLLGNATVVNVSYNGQPVNVNPNARNQSARLTIGS